MLGKRLLRFPKAFLGKSPAYNINHIKDMNDQNKRVKADLLQNAPLIENTSRIYKPTYTIQFNREGECLIYSANPIKNSTLYFKYPYIFYQSLIPLAILNYVLNPFELAWFWCSFGLYGSTFLVTPRIWYFSDFKYVPRRLFLLRGGRVLKVQSQSVGNDRFTYWLQNQHVKPLTEDKLRFDNKEQADFLTEQGQLRYDLDVQVEQFKLWGVNTNNQQLQFKSHGTVHHPQLFQAAMKGYNIDTNDFVINTADNIRYKQPNYDQ